MGLLIKTFVWAIIFQLRYFENILAFLIGDGVTNFTDWTLQVNGVLYKGWTLIVLCAAVDIVVICTFFFFVKLLSTANNKTKATTLDHNL